MQDKPCIHRIVICSEDTLVTRIVQKRPITMSHPREKVARNPAGSIGVDKVFLQTFILRKY